jgi:ankyrin repeat protein/transcriptional regulator with XRE-family HTH domain
LNIVRPVVSNWERGKGEPSTSQLVNLAQVLGVSVDTLVKNEDEGKQVVVVDTSILIKRPAIIKEIIEKFDEVIIPKIVIDELNDQKDNAKPWLKQRAWLIMRVIDEIKGKHKKITIPESMTLGNKNDEKIAQIAIERASQTFNDKIYVFADDVWFPYLVKEKQSNLFLLTYGDYVHQFIDNKEYDIQKTQHFIDLLRNKEFKTIKSKKYDPEVDINFIDTETGYTPLIQAIRFKNIDVIKYLIKEYQISLDLDCPDKHKYFLTPLSHTAQMQNLEIMKLLVEAGAEIDAGSRGDRSKETNTGNTPLMICAWHGFFDGVEYLVEQGACLNQQDDNGFTALTKACIKSYPKIVSLLLIKGTDINIRSRENKKAKEYIKPNKKNSLELYKLFEGVK